MSAELLLREFGRVGDHTDPIPRLRRFVLDLAVSGRLVDQDASEPPVDLEAGPDARSAERRTAKSGSRLSYPRTSTQSFPPGWTRATVGQIAECLDYMREPVNVDARNARTAGKRPNELFPYYGATQQQGWIDAYLFDEELVLLGEDGVPFLDRLRPKAYLIAGKTWVNNHAHVLRAIHATPRFLTLALNAFDYQGRVMGATRAKLNQGQMVTMPLAVPPLAEQHRIVAKVDELMALCDQLEAAQTELEARRDALRSVSLHRLTADGSSGPADVGFFLGQSPRLITKPEHVAAVRQTILNLAVRGRLVPQDPGDEPVADLLGDRIVKAENDADLPLGWATTTFSRLGQVLGGGTPSKSNPDFWVGSVPWVTPKDMKRDHIGDAIDHISEAAVAASAVKCIPQGSLLMVVRGMILNHSFPTALTVADVTINQDMKALVPFDARLQDMLLLITKGWRDVILAMVERSTHGTGRLGTSDLLGLTIPLPPLAEQQRIVAKVGELMGVCDELETALSSTQDGRGTLLEALLHDALEGVAVPALVVAGPMTGVLP